MVRMPEFTSPEDLSPEQKPVFDAIMERRGRIPRPFSFLLNSPEVAGHAERLGNHVRYESTLSPAQRELATITTSRECNCDFMWFMHARFAREAGVSEQTLEIVKHRGVLDTLDEDEGLIVQYGRELLHDHNVSESTFDAAQARFGNQGVTDLTAHFGYYSFVACILNAFEVLPLSDEEGLPEKP